jgi:hypothetical protein
MALMLKSPPEGRYVLKDHFLFDQPKWCKEGLILKALQGRLRIPFLITPVA